MELSIIVRFSNFEETKDIFFKISNMTIHILCLLLELENETFSIYELLRVTKVIILISILFRKIEFLIYTSLNLTIRIKE